MGACKSGDRLPSGCGGRSPDERKANGALLLEVQPHEAGPFFAHELRALAVEFVILLGGLLPGLRVAGCVQRRLRGLEGLVPLRVLLLELLVAQALGRRRQGDAIPDDEVELAVAIDVSDPDPRCMRRTREVALAKELAGLDRVPRLDQGLKG